MKLMALSLMDVGELPIDLRTAPFYLILDLVLNPIDIIVKSLSGCPITLIVEFCRCTFAFKLCAQRF